MDADSSAKGPSHCPRCGHGLAADFEFCPGCGAEAPRAVTPDPDPGTVTVLGFDAEADGATAPEASSRRRNLVVGFAIGAVSLVVTGLLGYVLWERHQDATVVAVFRPADAAFVKGYSAMVQAGSIDDLADAANLVQEAKPALEKAREQAGTRDTATADAVDKVAGAEMEVVDATAPLADLGDDASHWGDDHQALDQALESLRAVETERADLVGDEHRMDAASLESHVEQTVGAEIADEADQMLAVTFSDMQAAGTTSDLRAIGAGAVSSVAGLRAAEEGYDPTSHEASRLERLAQLDEAVAGLTAVDGDHLDEWTSARADILRAVSALETTDAARGEATEAVKSVDTLVEHARSALRTWHLRYERTIDNRARDLHIITSYRAAMNRLLGRYAGLRQDLSVWIDRVEDSSNYVTWDEAYRVLSDAQWQRQAVRDEMSGLTVPGRLGFAHNQVLAVIDDGIEAVASAYEGVSDAQSCGTSCYYADTPGWQRFQAESDRITGAYEDARSAWARAIARAVALTQARQPPPRPDV